MYNKNGFDYYGLNEFGEDSQGKVQYYNEFEGQNVDKYGYTSDDIRVFKKD